MYIVKRKGKIILATVSIKKLMAKNNTIRLDKEEFY
jgi:hypothetical protein